MFSAVKDVSYLFVCLFCIVNNVPELKLSMILEMDVVGGEI